MSKYLLSVLLCMSPVTSVMSCERPKKVINQLTKDQIDTILKQIPSIKSLSEWFSKNSFWKVADGHSDIIIAMNKRFYEVLYRDIGIALAIGAAAYIGWRLYKAYQKPRPIPEERKNTSYTPYPKDKNCWDPRRWQVENR